MKSSDIDSYKHGSFRRLTDQIPLSCTVSFSSPRCRRLAFQRPGNSAYVQIGSVNHVITFCLICLILFDSILVFLSVPYGMCANGTTLLHVLCQTVPSSTIGNAVNAVNRDYALP